MDQPSSREERDGRAQREPGAAGSGAGRREDGAGLSPRTSAILSAGAVFLVLLLLLWQRCGVAGCPDVDRLAAYLAGGAPVLLDRHGEPFAELAPATRNVVPLAELPEHVPEAFIAVEDQRFYEHDGVDWRRVGGAIIADIKAGGFAEGFSTIPMQLTRNLFPDRVPGAQKTPSRKLLEVRLARQIEGRYEKDEILELYLNHIYFGGSAYGIDAAAREYFGKPATRLELHEAATLAAMPKAPNAYHPRRNPERARERRDLVLTLMQRQGRVTGDAAAEARERGLGVRRPRPLDRPDRAAPYFVQLVRRQLEDRFGDDLYAAPLRIHTTLDPAAQRLAERELERQLARIERGAFGRFGGDGDNPLQGALVLLDADSGDVLALVGGRDYATAPYNRAVDARRQVGSAFKPFVFAAALEDGYAPSQRLADEPLRMELEGGEVWEPQNYTGEFEGEVTLREALVRSKNVPTVRLAAAMGTGEVADFARDAGVRGDIPELPSMALGTVHMSPLRLAAAYTAFANQGARVEPRVVTRVETPDGDVLLETEPRRRDAVDPAIAYIINDMLGESLRRGTSAPAREAGLRPPAAGKTGTTNDGADAWFVGYTPDLVGTVWIGLDRPRQIVARASGGRLAAPVMGRVMGRIDRPAPPEWAMPEGVVRRNVDPATGLVLREGCRADGGDAAEELFLEDALPAEVCPAGEDERGFFARIWDAVTDALGSAVAWIGDRIGGDDEAGPESERREREERYLGAPRLPTPEQVRGDSTPPRLLGEPVEDYEGPIRIDRPERPETDAEERGRGRGADRRGRGPPGRPAPGDTILLLERSDSGPVLVPVVVDSSGER